MTAKRMISGDVLKNRNGFFIPERYETCFRRSRNFALTLRGPVLDKPIVAESVRERAVSLSAWDKLPSAQG